MYIYNNDIQCIEDKDLNLERVFLGFINLNGKSIFVTRDSYVIGMISMTYFMNNYIFSNQMGYVKEFSYINYEDDESIIKVASAFIEEKAIKSSVPILRDGKLVGEVYWSDKKAGKGCKYFNDKLEEYSNSIYLSQEVYAAKKILSKQKVVVVGSNKEKYKLLATFFQNIISIDNSDVFEEIKKADSWIIDIDNNFYSRKELFSNIRIGIDFDEFFLYLLRKIEERVLTRYLTLFKKEEKKKFILHLKKKYSCIKYSFDQEIEAQFVIDFLNEAEVPILKGHDLFKGYTISKYKRNYDEFEMIITLKFILVRYFDQLDYGRISDMFPKQVLHVYLGKNIELANEEKKSFLSANYHLNRKYSEVYEVPRVRRTFEGDAMEYVNFFNKGQSVENGIRTTLFQPEYYERTIFFVGPCVIYGTYVRDEYTIPSIIQREFNDLEIHYRMVNLGWEYDFNHILRLKRANINQDDIIVVYDFEEDAEHAYCYDISEYMKPDKNKIHWRDCYEHVNENGSALFANAIKKVLINHISLYDNNKPTSIQKKNNIYDIYKKIPMDIYIKEKYDVTINSLLECYNVLKDDSVVGAIGMNANPFTKGHEFLVDYAVDKVDLLIVFVVSEDKSDFLFADRFNMVKMGVEKYSDKVLVVPSGIIASSIYFSEYFVEDKCKANGYISFVDECLLFARHYAPHAKIRYRFVATEWDDLTTIQYNRDLKKILPCYGIEVIEIERMKKKDEMVISAREVRKLYNQGDFVNMQELVPATTLEYLKNLSRVMEGL